MSVVVELFGILERTAGTKEFTIELTDSFTVEKLLDKLTKQFGEEFEKLLVDKESKQYVPLLLMINGSNGDPNMGDANLPPYAWSIGQTLIDKNDPTKLLKRADKPTINAVEKWEREGFSNNCTVMHDGMVYFKGQWMLYYGGGDKHIGLAIYDPKKK